MMFQKMKTKKNKRSVRKERSTLKKIEIIDQAFLKWIKKEFFDKIIERDIHSKKYKKSEKCFFLKEQKDRDKWNQRKKINNASNERYNKINRYTVEVFLN